MRVSYTQQQLNHLAKMRLSRFRALLDDYRNTWHFPAGRDAFLILWEKSRAA